ELKEQIRAQMAGYASPVGFYVEKLAEGIAQIAAAFAPAPVIVRLSDFKSNEYANLIGGSRYEPQEENPMLGFRGASRYVDEGFLEHFDGMSIGSNDLTQLTLGLDRDSAIVARHFDERDEAVRKLISMAIGACRAQGKYVGICGQGPSDHPDFARWLVEQGIESLRAAEQPESRARHDQVQIAAHAADRAVALAHGHARGRVHLEGDRPAVAAAAVRHERRGFRHRRFPTRPGQTGARDRDAARG